MYSTLYLNIFTLVLRTVVLQHVVVLLYNCTGVHFTLMSYLYKYYSTSIELRADDEHKLRMP